MTKTERTGTPGSTMDKAVYVREMFASIAPRYDAANNVLTGGVDERWRRRAVAALAAPTQAAASSMLAAERATWHFTCVRTDPTLDVVGGRFLRTDARARAPCVPAGKAPVACSSQRADVMALPYEAAFVRWRDHGIRDAQRRRHHRHAARNRVACSGPVRALSTSTFPKRRARSSSAPSTSTFTASFHSSADLIGGSRSAYRYLPQSLTNYPDADALAERFAAAGFGDVRYERLAGGAIAIHVGTA